MKRTTSALVASFLIFPVFAYAGEVVSKNAEKITLGGFTQSRWEISNDHSSNTSAARTVTSSFLVKRARLTIEAEITDKIWAEAQFDVVGSFLPKDALVGIKPHPGWRIRLGQYKRSFSQEELTSDPVTPTIDRGMCNDLLAASGLGYAGRDQGFTVDYTAPSKRVRLFAGVYNGTGEKGVAKGDQLGKDENFATMDTDAVKRLNRGKDFAVRLELTPDTDKKLKLGGGVTSRGVGRTETSTLDTHPQSFRAFDIDASYELAKGLTVYGEFDGGDNFASFSDTILSYSAPSFKGFHLGATYNVEFTRPGLFTAIQPEARLEQLDANDSVGEDRQRQITVGLSFFVGPNFRWRTNVLANSYELDTRDNDTRLISEFMVKL